MYLYILVCIYIYIFMYICVICVWYILYCIFRYMKVAFPEVKQSSPPEVGMAPKGRRPPATRRVPEPPHGAPHDPTDAPNGPRRGVMGFWCEICVWSVFWEWGGNNIVALFFFSCGAFIFILDLCTFMYRYMFFFLNSVLQDVYTKKR